MVKKAMDGSQDRADRAIGAASRGILPLDNQFLAGLISGS